MPDETPAAVTILPSIATRSLTGSAPKQARSSSHPQWLVALMPLSSPAALVIVEDTLLAHALLPLQPDPVVVAATAALDRGMPVVQVKRVRVGWF